MDKLKVPENCSALQVPKVNLQVWSNIRPKTRSVDLKLQRVQKPLLKGLTALAKLDENQQLTQDLKEAFLLLSVASFELNCVRKEMIKPDVNLEFSHLCSSKNKVSEWLFGNDLGKQVKDLQEESKATRGVMRGSAGANITNRRGRGRGRYNPYPNVRQNFQAAAAAAGWKSQSPFLGKGNSNQYQSWPKQNFRRRTNTMSTPSREVKKQTGVRDK